METRPDSDGNSRDAWDLLNEAHRGTEAIRILLEITDQLAMIDGTHCPHMDSDEADRLTVLFDSIQRRLKELDGMVTSLFEIEKVRRGFPPGDAQAGKHVAGGVQS